MNYEKDFYHWIAEREAIRIRKEVVRDPAPWTEDPIMANIRFCNVRREDDKVTRWIKMNWRDPMDNSPQLIFGMALARIINWPDTLARIRLPREPVWDIHHDFTMVLDWMQRQGIQIWGNAYMVTGGYSAGGETKQTIMARVLGHLKTRLDRGEHAGIDTLAGLSNFIQQSPGLGTFLAAQIVADVKYTPAWGDAEDWWTYCAPGPGSLMGLGFLLGKKSFSEREFSDEVNKLHPLILDAVGIPLTAHDTQNCLCEFSKYIRVKYLGGRAKRGYRPS